MGRCDAFIGASPQRVFEVLSDPRTYADWVPGSHRIRAADPDWPAAGSDFDHTLVTGISDHTTVCSVLAPVMLELRARGRPLPSANVTLQLQPEGDGTRVTMIEDPAHPALRVLIGPLGHGLIKLRNLEALRRLRALAEADPPPMRGEPALAPRER